METSKHYKWKSSRIEMEKSKETRRYLQTCVVKNPTPLHEEYYPKHQFLSQLTGCYMITL